MSEIEVPGDQSPEDEAIEALEIYQEAQSIVLESLEQAKARAELQSRIEAFNQRLARRHVSEPLAISARIEIPAGSEAYISRNHERLRGDPTDFTADGLERLELDSLVAVNTNQREWLNIDRLLPGLEIVPILPDDETADPSQSGV
jgi:hypothetical protein